MDRRLLIVSSLLLSLFAVLLVLGSGAGRLAEASSLRAGRTAAPMPTVYLLANNGDKTAVWDALEVGEADRVVMVGVTSENVVAAASWFP